MEKVLILGGTGTVGTALSNKLLADTDCQLTVFSRHATEVWSNDDRLTAIDGDATSREDLKAAVVGQDVVYCAISGADLPLVAENLVSVMDQENVNRLIFMGAIGIYNEIPKDMDDEDNLANQPAQIPNRKAVDIVENSDLNYTIIRPGLLRDGNKDDFVLTGKDEPCKGYITTLPSLIELAVKLILNKKESVRENITITRNMI